MNDYFFIASTFGFKNNQNQPPPETSTDRTAPSFDDDFDDDWSDEDEEVAVSLFFFSNFLKNSVWT